VKVVFMAVKPKPLETRHTVKQNLEIGLEIQNLQFSKVFDKNPIKDIVIQTINPHTRRGEHYHTKKTEWFVALDGQAELSWKEVGKLDGEVHRETMVADFEHLRIFEVQPNTCHWVDSYSEKVFLMASFSTVEFNESEPTTHIAKQSKLSLQFAGALNHVSHLFSPSTYVTCFCWCLSV